MQDFLTELGIDGQLDFSEDGSATLDLDDSNAYGKIYSILDRNDLVYEETTSSQMTIDTSSIQFESDNYILTLLADFNTDDYKLVLREKDN